MLYVLYSIHAENGNEILMIEDSRFRVQGLGFRVQGSGFKVQRVQRVQVCTCQQKLDTKLKKLGIKIEYLYKIQ